MKSSGIVKFFDNAKGFGFLIAQDIDEDIFVHYRSIIGEGYKTLKEGQQVDFVLTESDKGYQAAEVVPVADAIQNIDDVDIDDVHQGVV